MKNSRHIFFYFFILILPILLTIDACSDANGAVEQRHYNENLKLTIIKHTWYVRPAGSNVARPHDGTSKDHAFVGLSTVIWGQNGVSAGDRLLLCRGGNDPPYFTKTLTITASGDIGKPILIVSEYIDRPETIISERQINFPGLVGYSLASKNRSGNNAIIGSNLKYIYLKNIRIERCGGIKFYNSQNFSIENIEISDCYCGISLNGGQYNSIRNCKINNLIDFGIGLHGTDPAKTIPLRECIIENNTISNSLKSDGITLHRSNDEKKFNIGENNKVICNICYNNDEEGLDITSGTNTLVENNKTFSNTRSAVIWHGARDVIYVRNSSMNEAGLLVGPESGGATIAYNIIDANSPALIFSGGSNYKVFNNVLKTTSTASKQATISITNNTRSIKFINNIIINVGIQQNYVLRIDSDTPSSIDSYFIRNIWWFKESSLGKAITVRELFTHTFDEFQAFKNVSNNLYADPQLDEKYIPRKLSPCINTGENLPIEKHFASDFYGNEAPKGLRDIGAVEQ